MENQLFETENKSETELKDLTAALEIKTETKETETEEVFIIDEPEKLPEPIKEKKRGRPIKEKKEVVFETFKNDEEFFKEEETQFIAQEQNTGKTSVIDVIPADAILLLVDKTFSVIIPAVVNRLTGTKLKQDDFKLNSEEKKQLKQPLENALKTVDLNIKNPFVLLGLTALAIYGAKTAEALNVTGAEEKKDGRGRPRKNG